MTTNLGRPPQGVFPGAGPVLRHPRQEDGRLVENAGLIQVFRGCGTSGRFVIRSLETRSLFPPRGSTDQAGDDQMAA